MTMKSVGENEIPIVCVAAVRLHETQGRTVEVDCICGQRHEGIKWPVGHVGIGVVRMSCGTEVFVVVPDWCSDRRDRTGYAKRKFG